MVRHGVAGLPVETLRKVRGMLDRSILPAPGELGALPSLLGRAQPILPAVTRRMHRRDRESVLTARRTSMNVSVRSAEAGPTA